MKHLPDAQQIFAANGQKQELIESQMEKLRFLFAEKRFSVPQKSSLGRGDFKLQIYVWRLGCFKRIIREKDAKEINFNRN